MGAVLAVLLVLASGALMVATGVYVENGDTQDALIASLAAGVVAQAGFIVGRRAERPRPNGAPHRLRWSVLLAAIAVTFVAGAIMFAAGYAAASGLWYIAPLIAALAAPTILFSYWLDRRARRG